MHAKNYRHVKNRAYTRKEYARGFPPPKIVKFTMGNTGKKFPMRVELINLMHGQIRNNSLESARIAANRQLELQLGHDLYVMKVVPFPHIVLREHKRINVAQADRFQEGMKRPYGKPTGTAARVKRGEPLIVIEVEQEGVEIAREALKRAMDKFPVPSRIFVRENTE